MKTLQNNNVKKSNYMSKLRILLLIINNKNNISKENISTLRYYGIA